MGQALTSPITDKVKEREGADNRIYYGCSSMQGWRISMEDQHTTILNLNENTNAPVVSFFGVYDGHGGATVAQYVGDTLAKKIGSMEKFKQGDYIEALREAFLALDDDIVMDPKFQQEISGCTAVTCLITDDLKLIVANAGDSRAIMSSRGVAVGISMDHKPTDEIELSRIINAGGFVEAGRVNGNLALSRAFGDLEFKKNAQLRPQQQAVTVDPDVFDIQLTTEDEFVVLACDGIWDCLSNQEVVDFIHIKIAETGSLLQTCNLLMEKCLAPSVEFMGIGCDNMTIIIIALLNGKTKEEWVQSIKDNVEKRGLALIVPDGDTEKEDSEAPEFDDACGERASRRGED